MSRGFLRGVVSARDGTDAGKPIVGASVAIYQFGTTTLETATFYASATSLVPIAATLTTDASGAYEAWTDSPGLRVTVSASGGTPALAVATSEAADFIPDPGQTITKTDTQTLTQKTLTAPVIGGAGTLSGAGSLVGNSFALKALLTDAGGQWFNVKHPRFGAVGDGGYNGAGTDDTAAIQAAIDACVAVGGGVVYFPPGSYRLSSSLFNRGGVTFQGAGWSDVDDDGSGNPVPTEAVRIVWSGANNGTMIEHKPAVAGKVVMGGGYDGIVLDGYKASAVVAAYGIHFTGAQHSRIGRIRIRNINTWGVWYDDYLSGTDGAISTSNYIEDLDFVHGFWDGATMIGASSGAVYYHGSSFATASATSYAGVTRNLFTKIRGSVYNGNVVQYKFADNNHGIFVHTIGLGAGAWGAAGTGVGVYHETSDATGGGGATHSTHGFPAGNEVQNINGGVFISDYTHGNRVDRQSSEGGSIRINDITKGHVSYTCFDYVTLQEFATVQFPMTDTQSWGPGDMTAVSGSPTISAIASLWPAWALPTGSPTAVGGLRTPYLWSAGSILKARIHVSNTVANTGGNSATFKFRFLLATVSDGVGGSSVALSAESDTGGAPYTALTCDTSTNQGWFFDINAINLAYAQGDQVMWTLQRIGSGGSADAQAGSLLVREVELFFASTGPVNRGPGVAAYTTNPPTQLQLP